ncbi:uncharacterized protein LOC117512662 [Thalassophryne amazonica]|uniref:uncharacterized protein LOC117512662 n=1 Tax=Thalassophryne amazonica TaxID=390379 RepID=UPI001471E093|nr:uncharacterized protein LOC117512662 [Thalassophryne amazonica]
MSSATAACKTVHVSPSPHDSDGVILSQSGLLTHDQGQMLSAEVTLLEMNEAEYTHLQHLFEVSMETQALDPGRTDGRAQPAPQLMSTSSASSFLAAQAIDLSTSTDECSVTIRQPGEKTPAAYGEVPALVLAKVNSDESLTEPTAKMRPIMQRNSSARVCLEKRFMTIFQQSVEPREAVAYPQMQKYMDTSRANSFEVCCP